MSCDKVQINQFDHPEDLLKIFYPLSSGVDDELESTKRKFKAEVCFDLSLVAKLAVFGHENQIALVAPDCWSLEALKDQNPLNHVFGESPEWFKIQKRMKLSANDQITCVKILPIYLQNYPYILAYIIVGLKSGTIKIFNKLLMCIFEYKFIILPVLKIKLFSNKPVNEQLDQVIFLQYDNFCVKIDGLQLQLLLRKNEVLFKHDQSISNNVFYEIWYIKQGMNDFIYSGLTYEAIYDNMIDQSLFTEDKYFDVRDQRYIKKNLFVTVNDESFIYFYDLNKKEVEVTIKGAMTSLVSQMLPNFLTSLKKNDEPKFTSNNATLFFNLFKYTSGSSIVQSKTNYLALVYDQVKCNSSIRNSTVSLIDLKKREVIRVWKGYNNCQFSFIEIKNSVNNKSTQAQFVCLYLPDSKLIEIWPARFGDKIVSIETGSNCVLINSQIFFKGKNEINSDEPNLPSTALFDFDTFTCYTFDISFLCAITDYEINSRDDLLLEEIPRLMNKRSFKKEQLEPILKKLKSPESKLTILKIIFEKNDIDLIEYTVTNFEQTQSSETYEEQSLQRNLKFVTAFSQIYAYMSDKNECVANHIIKKNILKETPFNIVEESEHLKWKETDFTRIIPLFIFNEHLDPDDVHFELPTITIQEFMKFLNLSLEIDPQRDTCSMNLKQENVNKLSAFLFGYLIVKEQDFKILDFYIEHFISPLELIYLLFHAWSTNKFTYNWKSWKVLLMIATYLVEKYQKTIDNEQSFKRNLIDYLKEVCRLFLASSFIQSAIVGTYTIQVIYSLYYKKDKQVTDCYKTIDDDEWVEISLDEESFSSVLKQLEDIYLLNLLLQCGNSDVDSQISLVKLVKSKNSLTGELVASHCVRNLIDANVIADLDTKEEENTDENIKIESNFKTELDRTLKMLNETNEDLFGQLLRHAKLRFPCNLNTSVLLAHCAWQSIAKFIRNPSVTNQVHLQQCLNYLDRIKDPILKHKFALLIWMVFLKGRFIVINRILFEEKNWNYSDFSKLLEMDEIIIEPFIQFINDFLEFIFNTINAAYHAVQVDYKKDEWWMPKKHRQSMEDQQISIIDRALTLSIAKHNVTLVHSQLALLINLAINFRENMITSLKTCFTQTVTSLLFKGLHINLNLDDNDEHLKKCRERVLKKFAVYIARSVPVVTFGMPNEQEKKSFQEANSWISKLIELSQDWNIERKLVKTNYVFALYYVGCDALAKEELYTINDDEFIGKMFLQLMPARLLTLYGDKIYEKISLFPSDITKEIQRDSSQRVDFEVTLESTCDFIQSCMMKLRGNNYYFRMCNSLLQIIKSR